MSCIKNTPGSGRIFDILKCSANPAFSTELAYAHTCVHSPRVDIFKIIVAYFFLRFAFRVSFGKIDRESVSCENSGEAILRDAVYGAFENPISL